ncbi:hypothetical protein BHU72_03730 [Desulfuribacillus stibiiarsenatis]|uniref:Membrane dipeptidase n=1 Tax=Desulfuribacillus stibiiarsenatis TaxID=1390249 RepID=A0A1E5L7F3_9FIRM|nr:membrane dipeptidase [Desulfuribacillus stibiiarsenatis]OEH85893.1 hypothetical protein BHU72_03730 [Desulfuribacillus stibiiarsenatis]
MKIADGHCDYLYQKSRKQPTVISYSTLKQSRVNIQNFALFASKQGGSIESSEKILQEYQKQIQIFKDDFINRTDCVFIKSKNDFDNNSVLHVLLSLEGCDILAYSSDFFDQLWNLGARIFGLTWNHDNAFATCCHTKKNTGLTFKGIEFMHKLSKNHAIVDVSHLSEQSFWDIIALNESQPTIIASHSNSKTVCNHVRNLSDGQIKAIISSGGVIGINYVPEFLNEEKEKATMDDVIRHIDTIIKHGGENVVALGSDFDGAALIKELNSPHSLQILSYRLNKEFGDKIANKVMFENWKNFLLDRLP